VITSGSVRFHPSLEPFLTPIYTVSPHPHNPSSGDEEAIATSIEVSGMYRPVWAQTSTGHILGGNTTYAACLSLGASQIPVVWLDVDDEAALRILLGDNQLARLAIVDQGLLSPLLEQLLETELQLVGTGYLPPDEEPVPSEIEPAHTVSVNLTGEDLVRWFDLDADSDRDRLLYLLYR
jgi:hypothetical protein